MDDREPLLMNETERALFESTKAFVLKTCPKLSDAERAGVTARVYDSMHFVTKLTEAARLAEAVPGSVLCGKPPR